MGTEQAKVYCGKCRWFKWHRSYQAVESTIYSPPWDECVHPKNSQVIDTYRGQRDGREWIPLTKNAINDCALWELKPKKLRWFEKLERLGIKIPKGSIADRGGNNEQT